jgi:hypothetical protein
VNSLLRYAAHGVTAAAIMRFTKFCSDGFPAPDLLSYPLRIFLKVLVPSFKIVRNSLLAFLFLRFQKEMAIWFALLHQTG